MSPPRPLSRRELLGVVGIVVSGPLLASCELGPPGSAPAESPTASAPTPSRTTRTAEPTTPEQVDLTLAIDMLHACSVAAIITSRTARRHPRLAEALAPPIEVHRAHEQLLDGAAEGDHGVPSPPPVPQAAAAAWAAVLRREFDLQRALRDGAMRAQSGALARALASMSAAIAQQLAILPTSPPGRRA